MLELKGISKSFGNNAILYKVNLQVTCGETLVIIGRSGCGKSVLLKLIVGLLQPDTGSILFEGGDIPHLTRKELYRIRRRFGMLFQNAALFDSMTVSENIALSLVENRLLSVKDARVRVNTCLEMVGLAGIGDMKPADLSGGMRKRVSLARALAPDPELMLYDEPTTGLDPIMADVIDELIKSLKKRLNVTSIVVTHDMKSAYKVADRIAMLHQGEILFTGTPQEVQASENPIIRQFIEGRADGPINVKHI